MTAPDPGDFLTRLEAEALLEAARARDEAAKEAHADVHVRELLALRTAMEVQGRERTAHSIAHEREHELHESKHESERSGVKVALDAVDRERSIHADAHQREHAGHASEHKLNDLAITKSESAYDKRFSAVNEFREQLRDQAATLASAERVDAMAKDLDRRFNELNASVTQRFFQAEKLTQDRYDANRASIIAIEKLDVKGEGRNLGQGATIAAIVGSVGFAATLIGLIILISTILDRAPA